jgi:hypothetical protein
MQSSFGKKSIQIRASGLIVLTGLVLGLAKSQMAATALS